MPSEEQQVSGDPTCMKPGAGLQAKWMQLLPLPCLCVQPPQVIERLQTVWTKGQGIGFGIATINIAGFVCTANQNLFAPFINC